jgi:hypothetical protein
VRLSAECCIFIAILIAVIQIVVMLSVMAPKKKQGNKNNDFCCNRKVRATAIAQSVEHSTSKGFFAENF